jgi:hypothetical protein
LGSVKRDLSPDDYQSLLESFGLSGSGSTVDKRFKLPEISPSTESALNSAANVATIGGGIAKVWDAIDGSSSSSKRDETQFDERAFKIPASVTTWLKSLGNVASIGAGGAAVVGAVGGSNSSLKRELDQAFDGVDLTTLLNGATSQFEERGKSSTKPSSSETPSTSQTSGGGDILSKIAGGFSLLGAGSTLLSDLKNSTKRELDTDAYGIGLERPHFVNLTTVLNGAAPQFEDRSVSSSEVSGLESVLGKVATAASVGGTLATVWSALDPSSSSTASKRDIDMRSIPEEIQQILTQINARMVDLD